MAVASKSNKERKERKKHITLGVVYIKATFNNTIITVTDAQGNAVASSSSGGNGFKGAKKATPYAAQIAVNKASEAAKEHGVKTVSIRVQGAGVQRESAMRAVFGNFIVTSITDVSPVAHNGTRAPKKRRV